MNYLRSLENKCGFLKECLKDLRFKVTVQNKNINSKFVEFTFLYFISLYP